MTDIEKAREEGRREGLREAIAVCEERADVFRSAARGAGSIEGYEEHWATAVMYEVVADALRKKVSHV